MTQALLNNLNIIKDNSFNLSDNNIKADIKDFEKILDSKTNFDNSKTNNAEIKTDINTFKNEKNIENTEVFNEKINNQNQNQNQNQKSQTSVTGEQEIKATEKDTPKQTLGDLKNLMQQDSLSEEIKNSILENAAEAVIDLIIKEDDSEITGENTETDENSTVTQDSETDENITKETSITEEDSTMNKEMNAPENPTTVLLLSQIQTTVKLPASDNTEQTLQESVILQPDDDTDIQINQKFDDLLSKDIPLINNNSKNTASSKTEQPKQPVTLNEKMVKELNIESINAESTQNSASEDLMQNQTPQEQTVKIMIQGDIKTDAKIEIAKAAEVKPAEITPSKIIEQITKQLNGMYNNSKLEMVLNPGTLGKLHLHLMNTKDGLIAQFTVTTQDAKDILMKGLNGLKEALLAQGINVDNVSVRLEENESENSFDWTEQEGSKGGYKHQGAKKQKEQEKPFEQMMFEMENDDNLV